MSVEELGPAADAQPAAMGLVRALVGLGLVGLASDDRVLRTKMAALLGAGARGSMRDMALHFGGEACTGWSKLDHAVRTGESAFEVALGERFVSYAERNAEAGRVFDATSFDRQEVRRACAEPGWESGEMPR